MGRVFMAALIGAALQLSCKQMSADEIDSDLDSYSDFSTGSSQVCTYQESFERCAVMRKVGDRYVKARADEQQYEPCFQTKLEAVPVSCLEAPGGEQRFGTEEYATHCVFDSIKEEIVCQESRGAVSFKIGWTKIRSCLPGVRSKPGFLEESRSGERSILDEQPSYHLRVRARCTQNTTGPLPDPYAKPCRMGYERLGNGICKRHPCRGGKSILWNDAEDMCWDTVTDAPYDPDGMLGPRKYPSPGQAPVQQENNYPRKKGGSVYPTTKGGVK